MARGLVILCDNVKNDIIMHIFNMWIDKVNKLFIFINENFFFLYFNMTGRCNGGYFLICSFDYFISELSYVSLNRIC